MHIWSTAIRVVIVRVAIAVAPTAATNLDLLPTEWTVWRLKLGLDPLHQAVVVENVFAGRLANHRRLLEVLDADGAALLILLVLSIFEFLLWQELPQHSQLLLLLLLLDTLCHQWIVAPLVHMLHIVDGII